MAEHTLISYTSFGLLDSIAKRHLLSFLKNSTTLIRNTQIEEEFRTKKSNISPAMLVFYTDKLLKTNPAMFEWQTNVALIGLRQDLTLAYYHLCGRYQSNKNEHRHQKLSDYYKDLEKCNFLIRNVDIKLENRTAELEIQPEAKKSSLLSFLFDAELNFFIGRTVYIRKRMGDFNYWRLYWVWTGILLRTVLSLMANTFNNIQQTKYIATEYQNIWGYISWTLYFARLLINLAILLKHTIPCEYWMSKEEKTQGMWNRFSEQWKTKKFELANDFLWGFTNMVCHLWWVGPGALGYAGNIATAFLLLGDLLLSLKKGSEEQAEYANDLTKYENDKQSLCMKINLLPPADIKRKILEDQLARIEEAIAQCTINWKHKKRGSNIDRVYAASLLASFITLCSFLLPEGTLSVAASTAFGSSGAGLLFLVSYAYAVCKAYIEVNRARDTELRTLLECKKLLELPQANLTEREVKLNYLRYKQLEADSDYLHKLANHQFYKLARTVLIEFSIPLVIFFSFTFLSFGLATTILAFGFIIAVGSSQGLDYCKPEGAKQVELNDTMDFSPTGKLVDIEKNIQKATPYKPLKWLFHSPEELGERTVPALSHSR